MSAKVDAVRALFASIRYLVRTATPDELKFISLEFCHAQSSLQLIRASKMKPPAITICTEACDAQTESE